MWRSMEIRLSEIHGNERVTEYDSQVVENNWTMRFGEYGRQTVYGNGAYYLPK